MRVPSDGKEFYSKDSAASHRQSGETVFELKLISNGRAC